MAGTWQVWGDDGDPVLDGISEETAKAFVETHIHEQPELYIQNEEGDEFEYDGRHWLKT